VVGRQLGGPKDIIVSLERLAEIPDIGVCGRVNKAEASCVLSNMQTEAN
jgi:hypothetical protein